MATASNAAATAADEAVISFRIDAVSSGTLTKDGVAVIAGVTLLSIGETLLWTPAVNANGVLTACTVTAWDELLAFSNAVGVQVSVAAANDAPLAAAQSITATEDTTFTGTLTGSDVEGSSLTYSVVTQATTGVVTITNAATGAFTYVAWSP